MSTPSGEPSAKGRWVDTVAAILLALAAVATAWSSYQASRWTGEQGKAFSAANASRVESTRASSLANAQTEIDIALFIQWVDAHLRDEGELTDFYQQRFRDEFEPAFRAWLDTDPFIDPAAPDSPFAMPEYSVAANEQAKNMEATANSTAELARENVQRATNYVLGVVLFAVALFFAGISTKLPRLRLKKAILGVGVIVFFAAAAWIATFPISLSI
jgi:uncharacterized membrane protein YccC